MNEAYQEIEKHRDAHKSSAINQRGFGNEATAREHEQIALAYDKALGILRANLKTTND